MLYPLESCTFPDKKTEVKKKRKEFSVLLSSSVNVGMFAVNAGDCLTEQWELKEFLIRGPVAKSN